MVKRGLAKAMMRVRSSLFPRPVSLVVKAPACRAGDRQFNPDTGRCVVVHKQIQMF